MSGTPLRSALRAILDCTGPAPLAGNERRPGGRPARQDIHLCSSVDSCATCKARSRYEDPAQDHNRALTLTTSMPGDPQNADFETHQFKQDARRLQLQFARPRHVSRAGLGHSLAAAKFLELAQRATFAMLLVDLAARRVRSGADAAGPINGVRRPARSTG